MKIKIISRIIQTGLVICLLAILLPITCEAQRGGKDRSNVSKPASTQDKSQSRDLQKPAADKKATTRQPTGNTKNVSTGNKNNVSTGNKNNVSTGNRNNVNVNNNNNVNINNSKNVNVNVNKSTVVVANPRPYPRPPYAYGGHRYYAYHPYHYHPYTPYYYGPAFNPWGAVVVAIAATAVIVTVANQQYHYDQGVYYVSTGSSYTVVPAPVGATITTLPPGSQTVVVNETTNNYYYGGTYYEKKPEGYVVVPPTAGCVVENLPAGGKEVKVGEITYVKVGETYYQPIVKDGKDFYEVVEVKDDK